MLLLLRNDSGNSGNGCWITAAQSDKLLLEMPEHDALYGGGSGSDRIGPKDAGYGAQHKATDAAEPITTTASPPPALQLSVEDIPMPSLVRPEFIKLADQATCSEPRHKDLARIDAYGAMLARVIDLHDSITKIISHRLHEYFREAT